jgi:hypothetical protein
LQRLTLKTAMDEAETLAILRHTVVDASHIREPYSSNNVLLHQEIKNQVSQGDYPPFLEASIEAPLDGSQA